MTKDRKIESGDRGYLDEQSDDGSHTITRDESFWSDATGEKVGETDHLEDSIAVIKENSGAEDVDIQEQ